MTNRDQRLLFLPLTAVLLLLTFFASRLNLAGDFLAFWSGSVLTLRGENAYDATALHAVQLATGHSLPFPMLVWNPPWANVIMIPFGVLPFAWARALWLVCSLLFLALSGYWLARIYWKDASPGECLAAVIVPLLIPQAWNALYLGQNNTLILVAIAGALFFFHRYPKLSGAMLVLATLKPQLSLGAGVTLVIWALYERRWRFLAGAMSASGLLLFILTLLRPSWWQDYQVVFSHPLLASYQTPTLTTWLRMIWPTFPITLWMVGIAILAMASLARWMAHTAQWEAGVAIATIFTFLFTAYNWSYDQFLLLIPGYYLWGQVRQNTGSRVVVATGFVLINVLTLVTRLTSTNEFDFRWVVPAFAIFFSLSLFLFSSKTTSSSEHVGA